MTDKNNFFVNELNNIIESIINTGELNFNEESLKKSFFDDASHSADNLECMENIEFGVVDREICTGYKQEKYGIKIKNTDVMLSDLIYCMESEEGRDLISKHFPQLSMEQIASAQRVATIILLSFNYTRTIEL